MSDELVLCGHASPFAGGEPCPLEQGHDGGHVYWTQTLQPPRRRGRNGVWIVDENGDTIAHVSYDGIASAEEICALLALREAAADRLAGFDGVGLHEDER
jgi:hypothetical protein